MSYLFHVIEAEGWDRAKAEGQVRPASLETEGFVHLSSAEQVHATLRRHFPGRFGLMLLTVDPERLDAEIRWEEAEGGELFPHFYGPLPITAVVQTQELTVSTWERGS